MDDLHEIITEAIEDVELPAEDPDVPPSEPEVVAAHEPVVVPEAKPPTPDVVSTEPEKDDFEKKFGIPPQSLSGRENRIPYSRVKKITEKAVSDAKKEWETGTSPKFTEYEGKVKDYETRLNRVAKFEDMMLNRPDEFLDILSGIPAYTQFFKAIEAAIASHEAGGHQPPAPQPVAEMPLPDQDLSDGSKVYSMDGLKALLAWQAGQIETKVTKQVEDRYKPLETEWEAEKRTRQSAEERYRQEQHDAHIMQKIQGDIADARTWNQFTENEPAIITALQANPKISLEGAYRQVVFPKLTGDRNKIREEILRELKQAPRSTAAPAGAHKGAPATSPDNQSLEDIIAEEIKKLK